MKPSETECVIRRALEGRMADGAAAAALARSLSTSISYDAGLQQLNAEELEAAVAESAPSTEHHVIIAAVRKRRRNAEKTPGPHPDPRDGRMVNIGFFLRCWEAYSRDGHLRSIRMLTVSFLADWLTSEKKYIEDDEIGWCARTALKDAEAHGDAPDSRKAREAYDEAVVLLVMKKFAEGMKTKPEKVSALIEGWRKEYGDYCMKRFGAGPEPVPTGFLRNRAVSAFTAASA